MTDEQFLEVKSTMNNVIHEIVFACHHAEADEIEDSLNCLITVRDSLDALVTRLESLEEQTERTS